MMNTEFRRSFRILRLHTKILETRMCEVSEFLFRHNNIYMHSPIIDETLYLFSSFGQIVCFAYICIIETHEKLWCPRKLLVVLFIPKI